MAVEGEDFDLHPQGAQDITDIWEFIAITRGNPRAAGRVRQDIMDAIINLVAFPGMGHRRDDLTGRPLLFWPVRDYLIAYAPAKRPLWVIAVLHGSRDPRIMAAILRERE
ncbi:MAG: type II toxin-antitoxin system RelE/ParE family toxin [Chloroflexi bacterium]|nr:type II toxin-antitoxin system RelE/ParE family toxin [Chloroflexota bacterium]